jgi:hypothetical protein
MRTAVASLPRPRDQLSGQGGILGQGAGGSLNGGVADLAVGDPQRERLIRVADPTFEGGVSPVLALPQGATAAEADVAARCPRWLDVVPIAARVGRGIAHAASRRALCVPEPDERANLSAGGKNVHLCTGADDCVRS